MAVRLLPRELEIAWQSIRHGGKAPGPDGWTVAEFALVAADELSRLARQLTRGEYVHGPYRRVTVPKESGGWRTLSLANLRDRIVQRLLLERLTPRLEETASDASYAYRPGRGVKDALAAVVQWRERGFTHVLRADVAECFDSIRLDVVEPMLDELGLGDDEIRQLVLEAVAAAGPVGLPQGAVLSPALCNLVLTHLDRALCGKHLRVVRYADDLAILALSHHALQRAEHIASYALWQLGLRFNAAKTTLTSFADGFRFLGARFVGPFLFVERPQRYPRRPSGPPTRRRGDGLGYLV